MAVLLSLFAIACSRAKNDAQIIGEVVTKIQADPQASNKQIAVNSNNGVVTLNGSAATEAERAAISNDAAQVEGVKTVVNNLLVASVPSDMPMQAEAQQPAPTPAPAPAPVRERSRKPVAYREHRAAEKTSYEPAPSTPIAATPVYTPAVATPVPEVVSTPAPPPAPKPLTIEAGSSLSIRMIDSINSGTNHPGDIFHATLDSPLMSGETVVVPEGADVIGRVAEVKDAGHFAGQPELAIELTSIIINGQKYPIRTDQYREQGKSRGASTAKTVGTGAAIGAIIGGIAGGGKGAAIGAAAGAGMGGGVQAAKKAEEVHIQTEALLNFRLDTPITATPAPASQRRRLEDSSYSPPPPQNNNNNNYTDYSDNRSPDSTDRPVLRRRPPPNPEQN
ncbi:MAG: BON domain-containing protein [Terriglobales bacterium]